jgi:AraC-like DNA-binding protein
MVSALPSPSSPEYTVPAAYALQWVELASRWKIPKDELLFDLGLDPKALEEPAARLPLETMNALVAHTRKVTGEPGLGFYFGLQKRISMYGYLGFAMMSAATMRECIELAVRFTPILTGALSLRLSEHDGVAALTVEANADMGDVADIATIGLVVGIGQIGAMLTGREMKGIAELAIPEPDYYPRFAHIAPTLRFGHPETRLIFDAEVLDLPLAMADRAALRLAREQCERELESLGFDTEIGDRVRRALSTDDGFRSLGQVASELHVSRRTLTRRLVAQGLSFSEILEQERRDKALLLLRSRESLETIGERLGYSTLPNFIRAFQRWTGMTPAAYRRRFARGSSASQAPGR